MKSLTQEQQRELIMLHNKGWSFKSLANRYSISKTTAFFYYHGYTKDYTQSENPSEVENESLNQLPQTPESIAGGTTAIVPS